MRSPVDPRGQARQRAAAEHFLFEKTRDAPLRVCLAYPNAYRLAMGNLGFQSVYEIFDRSPGVVCERAFLPDRDAAAVAPGSLATLESGRRVADFDLIALSISFETDYLNIPSLLELIGVPWRAAERDESAPLIIAGGPAIFLNPEPIADFLDLCLIGEAEEMLPEFLEHYGDGAEPRRELLERIACAVGGAYVPEHYAPVYDGPRLVEHGYRGPARQQVERRLVWDLNRFPTTTRILSDEAVFGDMVMVEASRGCQWGCRFCAAGYMYRPIRTRSPESLDEALRDGLQHRKTIGLVGAEMASVPGVAELAATAVAAGGRLSPSSLKADCVTPGLAGSLASGGTRSATIAPEAGSERMRRIINKNLTEADILRAAELMVGEGVDHLKLYFMIGLPEETRDDVHAIAELVETIRARLGAGAKGAHRVGRVTVSVNPFVPKPWTPFQWDPMHSLSDLRATFRDLRKRCGRIPNLEFNSESPREGYLQTLLSRGDRRIATVIERIHRRGGDWWAEIRGWQRQGIDGVPHPDEYVHRTYGDDESFAWDFIDHGIAKSYLWVERRKAFAERQTAPCDTATCTSCQAC